MACDETHQRRWAYSGPFSCRLNSNTGGIATHTLCRLDIIINRAIGFDFKIHIGRDLAGCSTYSRRSMVSVKIRFFRS